MKKKKLHKKRKRWWKEKKNNQIIVWKKNAQSKSFFTFQTEYLYRVLTKKLVKESVVLNSQHSIHTLWFSAGEKEKWLLLLQLSQEYLISVDTFTRQTRKPEMTHRLLSSNSSLKTISPSFCLLSSLNCWRVPLTLPVEA